MFYTCENIIICSFSRFAKFYNGDTSRGWRAWGSRRQAPKEPYLAWTSFTTPFVSLPGEMDPKDKSGRKGEHVVDLEGNMVNYRSKMRHATRGLTFMNAHNQLRQRRPHTRLSRRTLLAADKHREVCVCSAQPVYATWYRLGQHQGAGGRTHLKC